MSRQWLKLETQGPLLVGMAKPSLHFAETNEVIPGAVIGGAVVEYMSREGEDIGKFMSGLRFGFMRPSTGNGEPSSPLPLTSYSCKAEPGFKGAAENRHGVVDTLVASLVYREMEREGGRFRYPLVFRCVDRGGCGSKLDKINGFFCRNGGVYELVRLGRSSYTKVGIDRQSGTASEGMLYSMTAVKGGSYFSGWVEGPDLKIDKVVEALEIMGVGASTSRGFGKVRCERLEAPPGESLEERVSSFNQEVAKAWSALRELLVDAGAVPDGPPRKYFTVDLLAPALLRDACGLSTLSLEAPVQGADYVAHFVQAEFVGGWSTAWGLPKETAYAACAGSAYVFGMDRLDDTMLDALRKLEASAIGEKTDEGFGELIICQPFHREVMPC